MEGQVLIQIYAPLWRCSGGPTISAPSVGINLWFNEGFNPSIIVVPLQH